MLDAGSLEIVEILLNLRLSLSSGGLGDWKLDGSGRGTHHFGAESRVFGADALVPVSFDKRVNCVPVGRDSRGLEDPMVVLQASRSSDSLCSSLDCLVVGPFRVFYTECNIGDAIAVRQNEP